MLDGTQFERAAAVLPFLGRATREERRDVEESAYLARIPAGRDVFVEGQDVEAIALLLSGVVRVYQVGASGREITLYRFGEGESCILTANAILSGQQFPAIATVEEDAEALMVPAAAFRAWVQRHALWSTFFIELLSHRLAIVMALVDEVAFGRMDQRVSSWILERARVANPVRVTHQEIAAELGSSREVISRIVEDLAGRGLIEAERGALTVLDFNALEDRAGLVT
ncbi:MAG: Crp/Fnr family transcriptional regulator [Dehalococcoidia bacterium]